MNLFRIISGCMIGMIMIPVSGYAQMSNEPLSKESTHWQSKRRSMDAIVPSLQTPVYQNIQQDALRMPPITCMKKALQSGATFEVILPAMVKAGVDAEVIVPPSILLGCPAFEAIKIPVQAGAEPLNVTLGAFEADVEEGVIIQALTNSGVKSVDAVIANAKQQLQMRAVVDELEYKNQKAIESKSK